MSRVRRSRHRQDANTGDDIESLLRALSGLGPADVAAHLQDMPGKRQQAVAEALDDRRLAYVLEELPEEDQINIIIGLADERAADVLEHMTDDDAADLLGELSVDEQERLFGLLEPKEELVGPDVAEPAPKAVPAYPDWRRLLPASKPTTPLSRTDALICRAVAHLPSHSQERWAEEWAYDQSQISGRIRKYVWAIAIRYISIRRLARTLSPAAAPADRS